MKRIQTKKPGSVGKRYPGQQHHFGKQVARANYTKFNPVAKHYGRSVLPSPADFYASEIEGFSEGNNGWASGCCPFHDDHNPSFAMNLDSGGYKCLSSNCGVSGGSLVGFVCALHGLSARDAYRFLEARA